MAKAGVEMLSDFAIGPAKEAPVKRRMEVKMVRVVGAIALCLM